MEINTQLKPLPVTPTPNRDPSTVPVPPAHADAEPAAEAESAKEPERAEIQAATKAINQQLDLEQRRVRLRIDERTNQPIISVVDVDSDEVVRQLPAEHVLRLAEFRAEHPPFPEPDSSAQLFDELA